MTNEDILEGNKLIAEFFGLKRGWWISQQKPLTDDKKQWCDLDGKTFLESKVYYDKDLLFNSSWDWLMAVVDKIESIDEDLIDTKRNYHFFIQKRLTRLVYNWAVYSTANDKMNMKAFAPSFKDYRHVVFGSKIQSTYTAVIEFIKWYNENKNK